MDCISSVLIINRGHNTVILCPGRTHLYTKPKTLGSRSENYCWRLTSLRYSGSTRTVFEHQSNPDPWVPARAMLWSAKLLHTGFIGYSQVLSPAGNSDSYSRPWREGHWSSDRRVRAGMMVINSLIIKVGCLFPRSTRYDYSVIWDIFFIITDVMTSEFKIGQVMKKKSFSF